MGVITIGRVPVAVDGDAGDRAGSRVPPSDGRVEGVPGPRKAR